MRVNQITSYLPIIAPLAPNVTDVCASTMPAMTASAPLRSLSVSRKPRETGADERCKSCSKHCELNCDSELGQGSVARKLAHPRTRSSR